MPLSTQIRGTARLLGLALAFAICVPAVTLVGAQTRQEREHELAALRDAQRRAAETESRLKAEIEALGEDRRKLAQSLIATASRIRDLESRAMASEVRLNTLDENDRAIRRSLAERRGVIGEVLAALQRIGRRPPPGLLVAPEQALETVRGAILLGAVLPEMRIEAEALSADLSELVRVRSEIAAERDRAASDLTTLAEDRRRMALLVDERQSRQADSERALETERQHIATLARQADNLRDLLGKLEQEPPARKGGAGTDKADRTQDKVQEKGAPKSNLAALKDPGRLSPAMAFGSARGLLPLPVNGVKLREFGVADGLGGQEKGMSIATRSAAQVTAPCDGWVVYAGPFRSYGQLLILNAGGGYHVLLAGMERISVDLGQFVLTGEPVATMGAGAQTAGAVSIGSSQPILYVEFRKDGTPVDPSPWWASESEKVRG